MNNITKIESDNPFPREGELADRMNNLIDEYADELSSVAVVGVLETIKSEIVLDILTGE